MLDLGGRAHRHRNAGSVSVEEHARHARQLPHQGDVEHQLPLPGAHRKASILAQTLVKNRFVDSTSCVGAVVPLFKSHFLVVLAQLVERLLPTPEIRGTNPIIRKILCTNCTIKNRKDERKEKEAGSGPSFFKKSHFSQNLLLEHTAPVSS